mmetsp:Transcript_1035/g.2231  ORF Transcript_1035/g.2231 Transcript_1035/m.2231 type:complete len:188 (+) Transcript_1035:58-621(+)
MATEHSFLTGRQSARASPLTSPATHSHITQQIPFYLLYYLSVYAFLLILQIGMLPITVGAKWIHHIREPGWIFPIDVVLVGMLVIEVGVHMFIAARWKDFFASWTGTMDFIIAILSGTMIVLDTVVPHKHGAISEDINDGEEDAGKIDLMRDLLRAARIFEFVYILKEVARDPEWHSNPSLFMEDVF